MTLAGHGPPLPDHQGFMDPSEKKATATYADALRGHKVFAPKSKLARDEDNESQSAEKAWDSMVDKPKGQLSKSAKSRTRQQEPKKEPDRRSFSYAEALKGTADTPPRRRQGREARTEPAHPAEGCSALTGPAALPKPAKDADTCGNTPSLHGEGATLQDQRQSERGPTVGHESSARRASPNGNRDAEGRLPDANLSGSSTITTGPERPIFGPYAGPKSLNRRNIPPSSTAASESWQQTHVSCDPRSLKQKSHSQKHKYPQRAPSVGEIPSSTLSHHCTHQTSPLLPEYHGNPTHLSCDSRRLKQRSHSPKHKYPQRAPSVGEPSSTISLHCTQQTSRPLAEYHTNTKRHHTMPRRRDHGLTPEVRARIDSMIERFCRAQGAARMEFTVEAIALHDQGVISLWDTQLGWDVLIECRDLTWRVHHDILCRESDWFRDRLPPKNPNGRHTTFNCDSHDANQLSYALYYMYHHNSEHNENGLSLVAPLTSALDGEPIRHAVFSFIAGVSVDCPRLMRAATDAIDASADLLESFFTQTPSLTIRQTNLESLYNPLGLALAMLYDQTMAQDIALGFIRAQQANNGDNSENDNNDHSATTNGGGNGPHISRAAAAAAERGAALMLPLRLAMTHLMDVTMMYLMLNEGFRTAFGTGWVPWLYPNMVQDNLFFGWRGWLDPRPADGDEPQAGAGSDNDDTGQERRQEGDEEVREEVAASEVDNDPSSGGGGDDDDDNRDSGSQLAPQVLVLREVAANARRITERSSWSPATTPRGSVSSDENLPSPTRSESSAGVFSNTTTAVQTTPENSPRRMRFMR